MATVISMLERAAIEYADLPYLVDKEDRYRPKSFRAVYEEARWIARYFLSLGLPRGTPFAILSEGRSSWVVAEFGLLMAGLVSVPLSIKLLPEEVLFRLNHSGARGVIASANTIELVLGILPGLDSRDFRIIDLDDDVSSAPGPDRAAPRLRPPPSCARVSFGDALVKGRALAEREEKLQGSIALIREDDVMTISYTSGTSGNPKGIMLTHRNYITNCRDAAELTQVPLGWRTLLILPIDHSFAHTVNIYTPLLRGIAVYFLDVRHGRASALKNIPLNLQEAKPQLLLTVPALSGNFMKKIKDEVGKKGVFASFIFNTGLKCGVRYNGNGYKKPSPLFRLLNSLPYLLAELLVFRKVRSFFGGDLAFCIGGGALLDVRQQQFFNAIGIPIYQGYGLTEAAPVISCNTPSRHKFGTSGVVGPSVECKILLSDGTEAKAGQNGHIVVRGGNVMKGYFKNPGATAETVQKGWLYTGDLGHFDSDGFLVVVGREKALLISGDGEKYSPEEIEEAIVHGSELALQVMLYNDHRRFTSALVVLDEPAVARLVSQKRVLEPEKLLNEIEYSLSSYERMPEYRGRFPGKWAPSTFLILRKPFSEQNKMINSTMKLVRFRIQETYRELLEYMYTKDGARVHNSRNISECESLLRRSSTARNSSFS
jgi:long-chain acyl-CoA synthetase